MNLKNETLEELHNNNLTKEDILWIGCREFYIDIERFFDLADEEYDNSYGAQLVPWDLRVVGNDWWLERHEYDGSEWWEFKRLPPKPLVCKNIDRVIGGGWDSLSYINGIKTDGD